MGRRGRFDTPKPEDLLATVRSYELSLMPPSPKCSPRGLGVLLQSLYEMYVGNVCVDVRSLLLAWRVVSSSPA